MITRVLSTGLDMLYPLRVIGVSLALWHYRAKLTSLLRKPSLAAIVAGTLAFVLWIAIAPGQLGADAAPAGTLAGMSRVAALVWLTFRVIGSVITVPIAEELAFRGYLLRKLIDSDFENVSFGQFTWPSLLGSSLLFAALHSSWLAGFVAGMIFAGALYRRGQFADAVGAHMASNAMLSAYVLVFHQWSLWS
jgi:CAAX prenyl protease-like protein